MIRALITTLLLLSLNTITIAQLVFEATYFTDSVSYSTLHIDSGSAWQLGTPTKAFLNGNYYGNHSITTSLDSNYKNNDTSSFIIDFLIHWSVMDFNYIESFVIDYYQRHQMHSGDFGDVSISFNYNDWYQLNDTNSHSFHYREAYNDTYYDSTNVSGFSAGWVHSRIFPCIHCFPHIQYPPYSYRIKFTFYSDSSINMEGWQIDNLFLKFYYDNTGGISELQENSSFQIAPNPANGIFSIKRESSKKERFTIFNNLGQIVKEGELLESEETIPLNLTPGIYFVRVSDGNSLSSQKLIVK